MLEVYRHGSQNGNAFEFRDPRKDTVKRYRLERKKTQEHEQADGGGHNDRWAHVRHEFMEGVRSHGGCSNQRQYGGQVRQGSTYEYEQDDCVKMES